MSSFPFRSFLVVLASSVLSCSNQSSDEIPLLLSTPKGSVDTYGLLARVDSLVEQAWYSSAMAAYTGLKDLYEQEANWPGYIRAKTGIGRIHSKNGHYDQAQEILQTTVNESSIFLPANSLDYGGALSELGRVYVRLGRFDEADSILNHAITVLSSANDFRPKLEGFTYQALGLLHHFQGNYDRALDYYEISYEHFIQLGKVGSYLKTVPLNNIANIFYRKGDSHKALDLHMKIVALRQSTLRENHPSIAASFGNLGIVFHALGDDNLAISYHFRAADIWKDNFGPQHPELAASYHNLGEALLTLGETEDAMEFLEQSIAIKEARLGKYHPRTAISYSTLGQILLERQNFVRAESLLVQAVDIWESSNLISRPSYWVALRNLGLLYSRNGATDQSRNILIRAQALTGKNPHPISATILNDLSELTDDSTPDRRLDILNKAAAANSPFFKSKDPAVNPSIRSALDDYELLRTLELKADTWMIFADKGEQRVEFLQRSLVTLQRGIELLEHIESKTSRSIVNSPARGRLAELSSKAISASLKLYNTTGRKRYLELAFRFADKRKFGLLLREVIERSALYSDLVPPALVNEEHSLAVKVANIERTLAESKLSGETPLSGLESLRLELFGAQQKRDLTERSFEANFPKYHAKKQEIFGTPISQLRRDVLDSNTALIEYVLEPDTLIIFVVTDDTLAGVGVSIPPNLDQVVDSLKWGITRGYAEWYLKYGHYLHELLLSPVESVIRSKDLIIVPEGILNYVPFEALLTKPFNGSYNRANFRDLPYVIKDRAVSYAYSSTLLHHSMTRVRDEPTKDFFAVAPVFEQDLELDSKARRFLSFNGIDTTASYGIVQFLPGTRDEVLGIEQMFKASAGLLGQFVYNKSEVLIEKEATEAALKSAQLGDYRYVHFATHSFVNERDGKLSGMLLLPDHTGRNDSEDGVLYSDETYSLDLNADLVVLSACETGIGNIAIGEGITGFSRGFIIAGAKNLVVSLWPSDDAGTKFLMLEFYYNILKGESIKNALRLAKLELINRGGIIAKPYFWSPFIQIGA